MGKYGCVTMCLLFGGVGYAQGADHFPSKMVALSKPEHVLAGVSVYNDTIQRVIKRLGRPDKVTTTTDADYPPGSGERSYGWKLDGYRLRVGTEFRTDTLSHKIVESVPIIVDVWGAQGGTTGGGLSLGSRMSAVRNIYGARFQKDPHAVTVQWKDQTTLIIDFSPKGVITHMQLMAAVE